MKVTKQLQKEFNRFFKYLQEDVRLNAKYAQMLRDLKKELK